MSDRDPRNVPPEDLPWNDVAADSDVPAGSEEPDPAEVEGDEGEEVDVARPRNVLPDDENRRDTLDERLAEEEPERFGAARDPEAGEILAAELEGGDDDVSLDLGESDDDGFDGDQAAEDAAIHVRPDDRR